MELNELPQMEPRALKATSVKAEDEHADSAEPQALKITAASSNPKMFTLPDVLFTNELMMPIVVDLPAPFGPSSA